MRTHVRPTMRGVLVGVVALLVGTFGQVAGASALVALGICAFAGVLVDVVVLVANRVHLVGRIVRQASPNPCFTGQPSTVTLSLATRRGAAIAWGGLPVEISDQLPSAAGQMSLDSSPSYQVVPSQRGAWRLGPATIRTAGPLGCWTQTLVDDTVTDLIAWPEVVTLGEENARADLPEDRLVGRIGLAVPRLDDMVLREYRPGDDLRRIHWPSSARTGALMTRVEEPAESRHAWIALWLDAAASESDRELAISLVGSCCLTWQQAGFEVDCHCGLHRMPGDAAAQLTELALLDPAADPLCLAAPTGPGMVDGPAALIVCPAPSERHVSAARLSAQVVPAALPPSLLDVPTRHPRVAVMLDADAAGSELLRDVGWTPVPLQADVPLAQAGAQLAQVLIGQDAVEGWAGAR